MPSKPPQSEELLEGHEPLVRIPAGCICPISQEVMEDPVVSADGASYERASIEEWFRRGSRTSPLTNLPLAHRFLTPNLALRSVIEEVQRLMPEVQQQRIKDDREIKDVSAILDSLAGTPDGADATRGNVDGRATSSGTTSSSSTSSAPPLGLTPGIEVQVTVVRGALLQACRDCNITTSKDGLRLQSLGLRGCVLKVDESDNTVQVNIEDVGTVWFGATALRPVVRTALADFVAGLKVRVNESKFVVFKACRDCKIDIKNDVLRLQSLGRIGRVLNADPSDQTVHVRFEDAGDVWFSAMALEPVVTMRSSDFKIGTRVQVHESMHAVLQACRDCNIDAKYDRLRCLSLGLVGDVLNVDATDATVEVSIKDVGDIWYGVAALTRAQGVAKREQGHHRLNFAPPSRVSSSASSQP